jgi:hypothetical protein
MIFSNTDSYLADTQRRDDHVRQLLSGSEFFGHKLSHPEFGPTIISLRLHSDSRHSNR